MPASEVRNCSSNTVLYSLCLRRRVTVEEFKNEIPRHFCILLYPIVMFHYAFLLLFFFPALLADLPLLMHVL